MFRHLAGAALLGLVSAALAQPVSQPIPIYDDGTPQPVVTAPPVLPEHPKNRAFDAVASGQGGMSYCGPAGAMSTAPDGSSCAVSCPQNRDHTVSCPPGFTAYCQCDTPPFAECRPQE